VLLRPGRTKDESWSHALLQRTFQALDEQNKGSMNAPTIEYMTVLEQLTKVAQLHSHHGRRNDKKAKGGKRTPKGHLYRSR
jgi:hypothetical protein